jgi:hypothetical protein
MIKFEINLQLERQNIAHLMVGWKMCPLNYYSRNLIKLYKPFFRMLGSDCP